jgi:hypothetical protein
MARAAPATSTRSHFANGSNHSPFRRRYSAPPVASYPSAWHAEVHGHRRLHRPKRPPKKQKPSALARAAKAAAATKALPAIVTPTGEKQLKRLRQERAQQAVAEPSPEVDAFFARNVRPGGPLPPEPSHKR